jgi:hypothetical protein
MAVKPFGDKNYGFFSKKTDEEAGYDSPTQFNREYKRQFGEPPRRDIERLLTAGMVAVLEDCTK